ncbi:MAG: ShlB/FhaC/HecB family hemolysin secretion/activation protein [Nostocaceae cyanobacterium]|nr:ShlB/FhaC/HecB family hemolysin secretion/activation protein [Nostocaceae cyanobacterium]
MSGNFKINFKKQFKFQFQYQFWLWLSLFFFINFITVKPLKAQIIRTTQELPPERDIQPPLTQPLPQPTPPASLPPPEDLLPLPTNQPSLPPDTQPGEPSQTISVTKFEITGSSVFNEADFAKITEPYTNRPISLAELFQIRSEITKLYVDNGYITSGAYIPPQKLQDGVVEIRVIEGKLEDIKVRGTVRLNPSYVRSRLKVATKKILNRDRLLEALQLLQLDPLIENLSAELSAGTRPGESLLEVQVKEADTFSTQVVLDNGRSPSVGSFRRQLQVNEGNFLGFGDRVNLTYTNTDGSNGLDLAYTIPINPRNGTLGFNFGLSDNEVIEEPFNVLDIESNSRYYELSLRQPVMQTPTQELAFGVTFTRRESKASLLDGDIAFPASGADDEGRTRVSALRFFQDWTVRSTQEVFALRSQFSIGLDVFNATTNASSPDSRFYAWRGQAQWVRLLARDTLLLLRGDVQFADRPLVPFEQFGLGGQQSVRGYRQDALLTDNGIFASAEVRFPIARFCGGRSLLQVVPFVDFGTVWNRSGREDSQEIDPDTLVSLGVGLRLQLEDWLSARFDWGIPLVTISGDEDSLQENGLYFSIVATPF